MSVVACVFCLLLSSCGENAQHDINDFVILHEDLLQTAVKEIENQFADANWITTTKKEPNLDSSEYVYSEREGNNQTNHDVYLQKIADAENMAGLYYERNDHVATTSSAFSPVYVFSENEILEKIIDSNKIDYIEKDSAQIKFVWENSDFVTNNYAYFEQGFCYTEKDILDSEIIDAEKSEYKEKGRGWEYKSDTLEYYAERIVNDFYYYKLIDSWTP
jgi:hypothetical protein